MGCSVPRIWLEEDGLVRIEYPQNFHVTLDVMESVYEQHLRITTEKRPILAYAESVASADYEAQQFASTEKAAALTSALAIIVKSVFTRAMGELFMRFHKPPYPTRIFNDEAQAIEWLVTFLPAEDESSAQRQNKSRAVPPAAPPG